MSDETEAAELVAYQNTNTGTIHVFDGRNADLDARPNFAEIALDKVPQELLDGAARARVDREQIAKAGLRRGAPPSTAPAEPVAMTLAHRQAVGTHSGEGVLSRAGIRNVQVGADVRVHPQGQYELRQVAESERAGAGDPRGILDEGRQADGPGGPAALAAARAGATVPVDAGEGGEGGDQADAATTDGETSAPAKKATPAKKTTPRKTAE